MHNRFRCAPFAHLSDDSLIQVVKPGSKQTRHVLLGVLREEEDAAELRRQWGSQWRDIDDIVRMRGGVPFSGPGENLTGDEVLERCRRLPQTSPGYARKLDRAADSHVRVPGDSDYQIEPMNDTPDHEKTTEQLTEERGAVYAHPRENFVTIQRIKNAFRDAFEKSPHAAALSDDARAIALEGADNIAVKLGRLAHSPTHLDSIADIAGYARTWKMGLDRLDEEEAAP